MNVAFMINYYSTDDDLDDISTLSEVHRGMESAADRMRELNDAPDNVNPDGTKKTIYYISMVSYVD